MSKETAKQKSDIPINKYEEDLIKAYEVLNKTNLPEILDNAVNAIDSAIMDIDMEANQEWHAKMTLESALMEIAEQIEKQPRLSIPKHIAEELDTKFADIHVLDLGYVLDQTGPYGSPEFDNYYFKNQDTIAAYMISKALGVELVEVTDA